MNRRIRGQGGSRGRRLVCPPHAWILALLFANCVAIANAQTSMLTMTTSWAPESSNGMPPVATNTIHNYSDVPLTAWLIMRKVKTKVDWFEMGYVENDSVLRPTNRAIAAGGEGTGDQHGGDPANVEFRLVAGIFADGSVYGDTAWAQYLVQRRRDGLQIAESIISDLAALRTLPQSGRAAFLEASKKRQLAAAKARQDETGAAARSLAAGGTRDTFEEKTQELKDANAADAAASHWVGEIANQYDKLINWISAADGTPSPEVKLDLTAKSYQETIQRLTESRPLLVGSSIPGAPRRQR